MKTKANKLEIEFIPLLEVKGRKMNPWKVVLDNQNVDLEQAFQTRKELPSWNIFNCSIWTKMKLNRCFMFLNTNTMSGSGFPVLICLDLRDGKYCWGFSFIESARALCLNHCDMQMVGNKFVITDRRKIFNCSNVIDIFTGEMQHYFKGKLMERIPGFQDRF